MRKAKRGLFLTMAATMLLSVNAYGAAPSGELIIHPAEHPVSVNSVSYKEDVVHADPRGEILSTGIVVINDNGDGTFYVRIETYAHENADRSGRRFLAFEPRHVCVRQPRHRARALFGRKFRL